MSVEFLHLRNRLRSGGTMRYHTHAARMIKTQDVAQHSFNVVWLAMALTHGRLSRDGVLAALEHDAAEHWTGDLPAPTKRALGIREQFAEFELGTMVQQFGGAVSAPNLLDSVVLKLADAMEGAMFCIHESSMGNRLMKGILENFADYTDQVLRSNEDFLAESARNGEFNLNLAAEVQRYIEFHRGSA